MITHKKVIGFSRMHHIGIPILDKNTFVRYLFGIVIYYRETNQPLVKYRFASIKLKRKFIIKNDYFF